MKARTWQIGAVGLLTLLVGLAWAGPDPDERCELHRGHFGMMHDGPNFDRLVEHLSRRLELDDTQTQAIRNIIDAARPEAEALRERARANHEAMRALEFSDSEYDVKLQNLALENGELATQLTLLRGRVLSEINAELSAEQQAQFAEGRNKMWKRFRHHRRQRPTDDAAT